MSVAAVDIEDAVAGYGDRHVLRGVDLSVAPGQAVALLGANGSGKSTLVRSALGLVRLSRGQVSLFGTALERFRQWQRVGFVPQRLTAGGGVPATAAEVVMAGRLSHRRLLWPASARDRRVVTECLNAVGLADRAADAVATLSGGQQQRVLIARALATEPDLLIMDEPTAGVDAENAELLAELLHQRRAAGAAILLVAHELGPLAELIDEAVVLSHGSVVHRGGVPRLVDSAGEHPHDAASATLLWSVA